MIVNYSHRFVSDVILSAYVSNIKLKNNHTVYKKKMTLYNTIHMCWAYNLRLKKFITQGRFVRRYI